MFLVVVKHSKTKVWSPTYKLFDSGEDAFKTAEQLSKQYNSSSAVRLYNLEDAFYKSWNENAV